MYMNIELLISRICVAFVKMALAGVDLEIRYGSGAREWVKTPNGWVIAWVQSSIFWQYFLMLIF